MSCPGGVENNDPAAELQKVPVTVITGFLGAGKTTLVNHILTGNHGKRISVIVNEFGEIGIDGGLVLKTEEEVFEMNNGCICCTVRGDLIRTLGRLLRRRQRFDAIVIETTGLADPAPVAQTFFVDEVLKAGCRLDAILTVVDTKHVLAHLTEQKPEGVLNEAVNQIASADKILLNKLDLVGEEEVAAVTRAVRRINAAVDIIPCTNAAPDLDAILGQSAFDLGRMLTADPTFLDLKIDVQHSDSEEEEEEGEGGAGGASRSKRHRGRASDADHDHDHDHDHTHDSSVTSVGFCCPGSVDLDRVSEWLGELLAERGDDIFRSKGVLAVAGSGDKVVFHGVHKMLRMGSSTGGGTPWQPREDRSNRLVFIGKGLDRAQLEASFKGCLVQSAPAA